MILSLVFFALFYKSVIGDCPDLCSCKSEDSRPYQCYSAYYDILVNCSTKALTKIPTNARNTCRLDLSGNSITTIQENAFSGQSRLLYLELSSNSITTIQENTFSGLSRLLSLLITDNNITTIQKNAFSGLSRLLDLGLSGNRITTIQENIFSGLSGLLDLFLSGNYLTRIQENTFSGLSSLLRLSLNGNPFHCDCELKGFVRFLKSKMFALGDPECASPGNLSGTLLIDLSVSNLTCLPGDISTLDKTDFEIGTSSLTLSTWETSSLTPSSTNVDVFTTSERNYFFYGIQSLITKSLRHDCRQ
ncbi:insulin-like growth factor-binding protein complex acid labile subunit isoform X5 [Saccostrea cucullata]|uniref:insulin-like growth factor-binding protein complex acid labile subunit isoform X5 n=1 Tax=Saccostrea cuccullata TaxID=36930 RepID=UPI002ED5AF23